MVNIFIYQTAPDVIGRAPTHFQWAGPVSLTHDKYKHAAMAMAIGFQALPMDYSWILAFLVKMNG